MTTRPRGAGRGGGGREKKTWRGLGGGGGPGGAGRGEFWGVKAGRAGHRALLHRGFRSGHGRCGRGGEVEVPRRGERSSLGPGRRRGGRDPGGRQSLLRRGGAGADGTGAERRGGAPEGRVGGPGSGGAPGGDGGRPGRGRELHGEKLLLLGGGPDRK